MKATKLAFERGYHDGSGVEFAVRYNANYHGAAVIEFERVNAIDFPVAELDWLIECLQRIRLELLPEQGIGSAGNE